MASLERQTHLNDIRALLDWLRFRSPELNPSAAVAVAAIPAAVWRVSAGELQYDGQQWHATCPPEDVRALLCRGMVLAWVETCCGAPLPVPLIEFAAMQFGEARAKRWAPLLLS